MVVHIEAMVLADTYMKGDFRFACLRLCGSPQLKIASVSIGQVAWYGSLG